MRSESFQFLSDILSAPSPSGFEEPVQQIVRGYVAPFADEVRTDVHGNVIAVKHPGGSPRVMLAGHCDQIGFMVQHINDEGYLHLEAIGGMDPAIVAGSHVIVHGKQGPIPGVIGRKPLHLLSEDERRNPQLEIRQMWVDLGARDRKAAEKLVQPGDPITFELGITRLGPDLIAAAGLDNKAGAFVVMEALRLIGRRKLACALYSVSTVQEELGARGARTAAYALDPLVGIAVDITFPTDCPGGDKTLMGEIRTGGGAALARGPNINPPLYELMVSAAEAEKIPWQPMPIPCVTPTDASVMQINRAGMAAGLVSLPTRYVHTPVEVVALRDLENAAKLLAATVLRITPEMDFVPRMILAIGTDIVQVERVEQLLAKYGERFTHRLFTAHEREICLARANAAECLAGRFAAKEAVMKALGTGYSSGVVFNEIELHGTEGQRPQAVLHGRTREVAEQRGAGAIHVSITHERTHAMAFVIIEKA